MNKTTFYMDKGLNGQSQCALCRIKGKWNVSWSSMMWCSYEFSEYQFCDECKEEIEIADENQRFYINKILEFSDKARKYDKIVRITEE